MSQKATLKALRSIEWMDKLIDPDMAVNNAWDIMHNNDTLSVSEKMQRLSDTLDLYGVEYLYPKETADRHWEASYVYLNAGDVYATTIYMPLIGNQQNFRIGCIADLADKVR